MSTHASSQPTIDELKALYAALKAKGQTAAPERRTSTPLPIAPNSIFSREVIPPGWYSAHKVPRGTTLRVINTSATPGIAAQIWNADDFSERFNAGDTVKVQWSAAISEGWLLLSDMGRSLAALTADSYGHHDAIGGISSPSSLTKAGANINTRNTRDNFAAGSAKLGLSRRDIHPAIQFFADVATNDDGAFHWSGNTIQPGAALDLRAEMNLYILLSNTPHPLSGILSASGDIEVTHYQAPSPTADDFCRTRTDEAARATDNTLAYFGEIRGGAHV